MLGPLYGMREELGARSKETGARYEVRGTRYEAGRGQRSDSGSIKENGGSINEISCVEMDCIRAFVAGYRLTRGRKFSFWRSLRMNRAILSD